MTLKDTKRSLRIHRITPNKLLGQNFLVEPSLFPKLSAYSEINQSDVVLDVGAGFGYLTCFLAGKCKKVIAIEKDLNVAKVLREQVKNKRNVITVEGDVLRTALPEFNKVIAIPPYYLSSRLVMWTLEHKIDCAVLVLQKEFGDRLAAAIGNEEYGWLTVVTNKNADVELLNEVPKNNFYPQPAVDSICVRLKPWKTKPFEVENSIFFVQLTKWLFAQRNKKLANAISPFIRTNFKLNKQESEKIAATLPSQDKRVRDLSPRDIGGITNALSNKKNQV